VYGFYYSDKCIEMSGGFDGGGFVLGGVLFYTLTSVSKLGGLTGGGFDRGGGLSYIQRRLGLADLSF
jgi:hypothetical protein